MNLPTPPPDEDHGQADPEVQEEKDWGSNLGLSWLRKGF